MNKLISISIVCSFFFMLVSCEDPVRTELNKVEKKLLDSLYSKKVSYVRQEMDSICKAEHQVLFDIAVDSFYQSYIKEIIEIYNQ